MEKFIRLFLIFGFLTFNIIWGVINHRYRKSELPVVKKWPSSGVLNGIKFLLFLIWFVVFFLAEGYQYKFMEKISGTAAILDGLKFLGLALCAMGGYLILWGRLSLKEFFSQKIVIKKNHEVVTEGPYRYLRHPIYLGGLLSIWGVTLALDSLVTLLVLAIPFIAVTIISVRAEEKLWESMSREKYDEYKRKVRSFIPVGRGKSSQPPK